MFVEFQAYRMRVNKIQARLVKALNQRQSRNAFARLYKLTLVLDRLDSEARMLGIKDAA